jgi:hypothetical protein
LCRGKKKKKKKKKKKQKKGHQVSCKNKQSPKLTSPKQGRIKTETGQKSPISPPNTAKIARNHRISLYVSEHASVTQNERTMGHNLAFWDHAAIYIKEKKNPHP